MCDVAVTCVVATCKLSVTLGTCNKSGAVRCTALAAERITTAWQLHADCLHTWVLTVLSDDTCWMC